MGAVGAFVWCKCNPCNRRFASILLKLLKSQWKLPRFDNQIATASDKSASNKRISLTLRFEAKDAGFLSTLD